MSDDLAYKFDFSKLTLPELLSWSALNRSAQFDPALMYDAMQMTLQLARKFLVTDVDTIPADMAGIFIREFADALNKWSAEMGLS